MKMIVGLGNIGAEYDNTPHNAGFMALDKMAQELNLSFKKKRKNGYVIEAEYEGVEVLLVKPLTFMNNSGDCVFALSKKYRIAPRDICVILDDVDLTAGLCRIRPVGSAGTHNGLRSVTTRLGTTDFTRIKIGVDTPSRKGDLADFVLRKMRAQELQSVEVGVEKAVAYAYEFIKGTHSADTK